MLPIIVETQYLFCFAKNKKGIKDDMNTVSIYSLIQQIIKIYPSKIILICSQNVY